MMILLLAVVLLLCLAATLFGLPGNWLMVLALTGYAYWGLGAGKAAAWPYVLGALALALLGEVSEVVASAAGVAKGGSKRGAVLGMLGAFVGSGVGAAVGLPIPLVGSLVGVLIGASLGAMLGAVIGELWKGQRLGASLAIGQAAFWGRLVGSGVKLLCGGLIVLDGLLLAVMTRELLL